MAHLNAHTHAMPATPGPASLRIGAVAQATGLTVETIRYYEQQGLLPPPLRLDNGYRTYGDAHVRRLAFIRHCRAMDMPLTDVMALLALVDGTAPTRPTAPNAAAPHSARAVIERQLDRVQARLSSLQALHEQLLHLQAHCQCNTAAPTQPCGLLQTLVAAAQGEACACDEPLNLGG